MNEQHTINPDWKKRLQGLIPETLLKKTVLIVGCGSVGSFVADELTRAGIKKFILIDPDVIEWSNLTRTTYNAADVGKLKVDCLKKSLQLIFTDVEAEIYADEVKETPLQDLINKCDIVISAVDDPAATNRLNRFSYVLNKTMVCVGLYRGANGGEVLIIDNEHTPCYSCSTGGVRNIVRESGFESVERDRDYGTSKLTAEVALGSDIHFVCCAAVKIIISVLSKGTNTPLASFVNSMIEDSTNYLIMGMEPNYYLFPSTHTNAMGQHAFQSIWAKTEVNPECEICGLPENREENLLR